MQHIQGISRHQLQMSSLEDKISADNPESWFEIGTAEVTKQSVSLYFEVYGFFFFLVFLFEKNYSETLIIIPAHVARIPKITLKAMYKSAKSEFPV